MIQNSMRFQDWVDRFRPIKNPLDPEAEDDGYAFEIRGLQVEEVERAYAREPGTVWTRVEAEGFVTITSGRHFVNREKYYITQVPCPHDEMIEVPLFSPDDFDGNIED